MPSYIALPLLSTALTAHAGRKAPGYPQLYLFAIGGTIPAERIGKRWFVREDRVPETAAILGLTSIAASRASA